MDDDEVVVVLELGRVQLLIAAEDVALLFGQPLRVSLERVVDRLRDVPELVAALDDPPLGIEAGAAHERDERVVDLRHTAAERRGRKVDDALALERLRKPADLVHQTTSRNRGVVGKRLMSGVDELEHGLGARFERSNGRENTARAG